ncbi:hypothetical protein DVH24_027961 [Malus domestica]|uniref:Uncharacterized protein n=1 Tax=Malus domestica TaxID=3750 RepID=A0A498HC10_MALDO|nr:hypothetical protein DVH24_027961 [Malus domestica]
MDIPVNRWGIRYPVDLRFSSASLRPLLSLALSICFVCFSLLCPIYLLLSLPPFIKPVEIGAPLNCFPEARAVEHIRVMAQEIDDRQVSSLFIALAAFFSPFCPN